MNPFQLLGIIFVILFAVGALSVFLRFNASQKTPENLGTAISSLVILGIPEWIDWLEWASANLAGIALFVVIILIALYIYYNGG